MKSEIQTYFSEVNQDFESLQLEEQLYLRPEIEQKIRSDIRSMLGTYSDQNWTGRALARVLHGIASPNYPAKVWGRVFRFWRLHLSVDFNLLVSLATKEIISCR